MLYKIRTKVFSRLFQQTQTPRWRFTSNGKIILAIAFISSIIGIDTRQNLSYQIFSLLAALILVAILFSSRKKNQFHIERSLPSLATAEQEITYHITINNLIDKNYSDIFISDKLRSTLPSTVEFKNFHDSVGNKENSFDRLVGFPRWLRLVEKKLGASEPSNILTNLPALQKREVTFKLTPLRRGYINFSGITIGLPDTLGLFQRFQNLTSTDQLLILPKRYKIPSISLKGNSHHHPGGVALASSIGDASEFHGLRDYRPGDPIRHIHWRSWARTGSPVVKTYEQEYFVHHALVLDTYTKHIPPHLFEEAVSIAASLALNIDDQESLLDLLFIAKQRYQITSGRHTEGIQTFLEVLACVEPQHENSVSELKQFILESVNILSNVICIFLTLDEQRDEMIQALKEREVNLIILVLCDEKPNHDIQHNQLFYIRAGRVEEDLKQLSTLNK